MDNHFEREKRRSASVPTDEKRERGERTADPPITYALTAVDGLLAIALCEEEKLAEKLAEL